MIDHTQSQEQLAIRCQFLRRSSGDGRMEPVALCAHPTREGSPCVGPFLHDLTTDCGLWEPRVDGHLLDATPFEYRRRRRRGGYDMHRGWR